MPITAQCLRIFSGVLSAPLPSRATPRAHRSFSPPSLSVAGIHAGIGWSRPMLRPRHRVPVDRRQVGFSTIGESMVPDAVPEERPSGLEQNVELVALMALWYILNICFNIYNKQVLKVYPFPMTISAFQFAIGSILIFIMWSTNLYKRPKISISQFATILPLAIAHTLGNLFTNISLGKVSVSFTHTIKAMEPFFSVMFSALFLGELPTFWILSSLVPIVGGVALASFTEASFNWTGFWSAMASNVTNQSRNVLSKKLMAEKVFFQSLCRWGTTRSLIFQRLIAGNHLENPPFKETLDNITLFSIITIMSFFLTVPVTLYVEGIKFTPAYLQSTGLREIYFRCFLSGFCFHTYQQVSYMILARVSPVTHSVSNCVKRVVVIVSSVLFFRTPVSAINSLGTAVALAGVFLYSRVKKSKPKAA